MTTESTNLDRISLLKQREHDRQSDLQKRKLDKDQTGAINETLQYFQTTFNNQRAEIDDLIDKSRQIDRNDLINHFNMIANRILTLQKYVANSTGFLRNYDIKKSQEVLQDLTNRLKDYEAELVPKKKFAFKTKKTKPQDNTPSTEDTVDFPRKPTTIKKICGFSDRTDEDALIMINEQIDKNDVEIENLTNCTVKLYGNPSTLHLNSLKNCRIFTGPVSTSIFVTNCENSTLILACQQLRLHNSHNNRIYLHVTSRAIIEDCRDIFVTPYNWKYPNLIQDFNKSGLDLGTNNWRCIDDFNWLNQEKASPNWSILSDDLIENW